MLTAGRGVDHVGGFHRQRVVEIIIQLSIRELTDDTYNRTALSAETEAWGGGAQCLTACEATSLSEWCIAKIVNINRLVNYDAIISKLSKHYDVTQRTPPVS